MRIAVEGCAHGELEIIYDSLEEIAKRDGKKVDLLICCGDFQSTRNLDDLSSMAVPDKYKNICTFYKYYSGEKTAPVLTIFIGGNHEASNYLQELPYGGWVAPNIYYMGYANVINVCGLRIAGLSGIYKSQNLLRGHFESPPYNDSTMRSVYHVRNLEVFRLKQISGKIDIFLSHDWPAGVTKFGNENGLVKRKPFFKDDIDSNSLGSPPSMELLKLHYPTYWFSAHLHCKFAAVIPNEDKSKFTKFLALDKCLPKRKFLQIVEVESDEDAKVELEYDLEWLTILHSTNHLLSIKDSIQYMPGQDGNCRWDFKPTEMERISVLKKFNDNLKIPENFLRTAPILNSANGQSPIFCLNKQTTEFCNKLEIDDPSTLIILLRGNSLEDHIPLNDFPSQAPKDDQHAQNDSPSKLSNSNEAHEEDEISLDEFPSRVSYLDEAQKDDISKNIVQHESPKDPILTAEFPPLREKSYKNEEEEKDELEVDKTSQVEPTTKKLKRRNQSFYTNAPE